MTRLSPLLYLPLLCIQLSLLWGLSATEALGQLTSADRERLLQEIQAAQGELDPSRLPDLDLATTQLRERVDGLEELAEQGG